MPRKPLTRKIPLPLELTQSDGEAVFAFYLRTAGKDLPPAVREYEIPEGGKIEDGQAFRADFAWPDARLLFEVQGNGHERYKKYREDWIRHSLLTLWGYRVIYATPDQIKDKPDHFIGILRQLLNKKGCRHE